MRFHICQSCKRRLVAAIEKAVVELVAFRRQARESYNAFVTCRRGSGLAGKRTKESIADVGV